VDARRLNACYLDSSALVRVLLREGELGAIEEAFDGRPVTSALAELEVRAAISKRWRDGDLSEAGRDRGLDQAESGLFQSVTLLDLSRVVLTIARDLVVRFSIRSLDAIHLATAVRFERQATPNDISFQFCSADIRQAGAAQELFGVRQVIIIPPWRGKTVPPG
jgi:predicted nucleic acid-binding protein